MMRRSKRARRWGGGRGSQRLMIETLARIA
jgi:hypothetical protein